MNTENQNTTSQGLPFMQIGGQQSEFKEFYNDNGFRAGYKIIAPGEFEYFVEDVKTGNKSQYTSDDLYHGHEKGIAELKEKAKNGGSEKLAFTKDELQQAIADGIRAAQPKPKLTPVQEAIKKSLQDQVQGTTEFEIPDIIESKSDNHKTRLSNAIKKSMKNLNQNA